MQKVELRKLYKEKRKAFSRKEIDQKSSEILRNLKSMEIWDNSVFHVFVSIPGFNEVNTHPIIEYLFAENKKVVVPKTFGREMKACLIDPKTRWETGKFGVKEPKTCNEFDAQLIDIILMPLLIYDKQGNRIGYGGGFYDRFLKKTSPKVLKIGLCIFPPIEIIEDAEPTDIPMDYCVTDSEIVSFTSGD